MENYFDIYYIKNSFQGIISSDLYFINHHFLKRYIKIISKFKERNLVRKEHPRFHGHHIIPIPLKDIVPLIEYKSLFSLQRDNDLEALEGFPNVLNLSTLLKSFEDTLAVIHHLDVVITSDTSIAHAAASMGKRTFIFTPISAYYLYCNSFKYITPWYGENVTVLRQITPRSWDEPLEELKSFIPYLTSCNLQRSN